MENTVAIGDGLNDISMMEKAHISIAMGNAVDEIKRICHYETLSNEEHGVAHALYQYVMVKNKKESIKDSFLFFY